MVRKDRGAGPGPRFLAGGRTPPWMRRSPCSPAWRDRARDDARGSRRSRSPARLLDHSSVSALEAWKRRAKQLSSSRAGCDIQAKTLRCGMQLANISQAYRRRRMPTPCLSYPIRPSMRERNLGAGLPFEHGAWRQVPGHEEKCPPMGQQGYRQRYVKQDLWKDRRRYQDEARGKIGGQAVCQRYHQSARENRNGGEQRADGCHTLGGEQRCVEVSTD